MLDQASYTPRLKAEFRDRIRAAMKEEFGYRNDMQIPRLDKIVLNMSEVLYVDSSGLGELVHSYNLVKAAGGRLKLMKLQELARDLIQITRLYTIFEVFQDEDAAVASFRTAA